MHLKHAAAAALVPLALLTACSSHHEIDRQAWGRDLADAGVTVTDWPKIESATRDMCDDNDTELQYAVAAFKDAGTPLRTVEIGFRHVCPDRVDALEAAADKLTQTQAEFAVICGVPASERTQRQQDLVEAGGCGK